MWKNASKNDIKQNKLKVILKEDINQGIEKIVYIYIYICIYMYIFSQKSQRLKK